MMTVPVAISAISDLDDKMFGVHALVTALALMGGGVHRLPTEEDASDSIVRVAYLLKDLVETVQSDILALRVGGEA